METLVVQDVDLELLRRHRAVGVSESWSALRPDLYRMRFCNDGEWQDVEYPD